ncbi:MAG TPA: bifunctional (p)ppGpp synthetase/guanosine-3',5'-bis(diphosphate) 3'-pyrophosphohydrolase [Thermoleophilia bacterium]|nr:bifunctional (p)ppGpp synthetase/guanosine-3',5'-bis(diphosphate) 3'-pyrophosphohydrolase [Thermoleophilia bacterium]
MAPTAHRPVPAALLDGADLEALPAEARALFDGLASAIERYDLDYDRDLVARAFSVAHALHGDQKRKSGEPFINHPVGTALLCAELKLDSTTIAAALLHDVVEDTATPLGAIADEFGDEIAMLVDSVTKLTKLSFNSQEEEQAENYRKMIVAMASDIRVILIKLCDRLHNMHTLGYLSKQKQLQKAKETLEIYAPLAHRLGIYSIKWQLEDLAFATLHPRKYAEIQQMVAQRRADRVDYVDEAAGFLEGELARVGIHSEITGRAKHFYSIYVKMSRRGKEFNEIFDLTGLRVLVDSVKDCYGAVGIIHALWKPIPGRFKDYVAMPKFNLYQSLHTTVIGPGGKPLEIQIRTFEQHQTAEYGVAAHWLYKEKPDKHGSDKLAWLRQMMEWQSETGDPREFMETLKIDLFEDEVFVFTPKGEVKNLPAGATPLDFAYAVHTDVGNRCVGAKVDGRIVPLHHKLHSGDIVEIVTAKSSKGPSRDWLGIAASPRARQKIKQYFRREEREDSQHSGRDLLQETLRRAGVPAQKVLTSSEFAAIAREVGFARTDDLYAAIGSGRVPVRTVVNKVLGHTGTMKAAVPEVAMLPTSTAAQSQTAAVSSEFGISVDGLRDIVVRMAKCCKPIPGDEILGYISLGKGVTIHRADCKNARALMKNRERFTTVSWDGIGGVAFRVEIQVEALDRNHLLEDISRTLSDSGVNIINGSVQTLPDGVVRDRFTVEVGDVRQLDNILANIRAIPTVYDAYRRVAT